MAAQMARHVRVLRRLWMRECGAGDSGFQVLRSSQASSFQ
jgi:hypothetical protein